jgi:hypothetical protein
VLAAHCSPPQAATSEALCLEALGLRSFQGRPSSPSVDPSPYVLFDSESLLLGQIDGARLGSDRVLWRGKGRSL